VITAVTAQNTAGVQGIHTVPADFVEKQMISVLTDIGADVVKTGMLPTVDIIRSICDVLKTYPVKGTFMKGPSDSFEFQLPETCSSCLEKE
jgi:hydroxymethylpyrimidine/phosphomethylpyrimidine kinase